MVDFIPDGTRVRLAAQPDKDIPEQFGTVHHDLGGENVPVYIDGMNTTLYPHDYTPVPRGQVTVLEGKDAED